ncbi:hypothetical protein MTR_0014s0490 [Medicago truncatula]|uniref:Putative plant transposon protein domain-containing protein n=1 Tax=Medicago truncatula TaxID=3880 RepID=A0A072TJ54_MEDTR|nr:hypothetical protein MTR_0014s0490 [Medicago truncatula]
MARTKTSSRVRSQSPPNAANDQSSDHSPLNETPLHTILQDVIILAHDTSKSSKHKTSKKPIRRSQRMRKGSSSKPTTTHVDLVSDNEEKNGVSDEEKSEKSEEEISGKGKGVTEEEASSEKTEETLLQVAKAAKIVYQRRKQITKEALPLPEEKTSSEDEQEAETEEEEYVPRKRGKGKDIAILASSLKVQSAEKMANRPISRSKYFDFESLKKKGWNLKKLTDPQGWSSFVSTQCQTFPDLVKEFYANMTVKEHNEEKFLESTVKGVRIQVSHNLLSDILKIPNEGNELYNSWFSSVGVTREQLFEEYIKPNHDINSTNLEDTPKILHNMIRHTLLPRCGSFEVITDTDLCIIYHLITKTKLNLCFVMLQHMMDQCYSFKQKVAGLPYGMHLTPIFEAAGISLGKEKGQDTFMRFTAKTISQLHITTSNMPIPQKTGSVKRLADQKVQEVRKKQKTDKPAKKEIGSSSQNVEKGKATPALEKAAENVGESDADHQNVEDSLNQGVEAPSEDVRVEENIELQAQNVDTDTRETAEILVSNTFGSENQPMDVEEEVVLEQENVEAHPDFDLNIEDTTNDLYEELFQDAQGENIQQDDQNLSADPNPLGSGSLPSEKVQLLAQTGQNVQRDQNVPSAQNMEQAQFVNLSTSTMGSTAGISKYLVSSLPTPSTIPSFTPPPPQTKTTQNLPNMSSLFDSLNTFVTANKRKADVSGDAAPAKPSKAEKMVARALRVATKTHKIVCALANWTRDVQAPGLAVDKPVFVDPTVFESEPSSDSRDSTP